MFYNRQSELICIIDDSSRVELLEFETLGVVNGIYTGRKVQIASAATFIYVHNDKFLNVFTWDLALV